MLNSTVSPALIALLAHWVKEAYPTVYLIKIGLTFKIII
jgi:hypothetical protein